MSANYGEIKKYLRNVGQTAWRVHLGKGAALLGTVLLLLLLVGLVFANQLLSIPYAHAGYLILCISILIYVSYRYVITPALPLGSEDKLALIIEERLPGLKDLLISSLQLGRDLEKPERAQLYSHELIYSLFKQTAEKLHDVRPTDIVERQDLKRNVKVFGAAVCIFVLLVIMNPRYVSQRFHLLLGSQYAPSALIHPGKPVIGDITLTYRYPAYTGLMSRTISGSSGDVKALKGSEVEILASSNQRIASASILVNASTKVPMAVETVNTIKGCLIVLEDGSYSFEVIPVGEKLGHTSQSHKIVVEEDAYPEINILSPTSEKVVSERDVIGLLYDAADDFGLKEIRLVVDEGPEAEPVKKDLKVVKETERQCRDTFNWDLSTLRLTPGKKVSYYLEAVDNDAVSGPKVARSKTQYLEVYSTQKRHEELLSLQDELLQEMVQLLAEKLVNRPDATKSKDELLLQQDTLLERTVNMLVLFDKVLTNMENDVLANYAVYYSLENMRNTVSQLSDGRKKYLEEIERGGPILPVGVITEIQGMQDREVVELENDIMFLVELLRKQRLDDMLNQDRNIEDMEKTLTNLLQDLEQGKTGELEDRALKELQKLEDVIRSIMEKLAKMSSNWGDEFLNMDALDSLKELTLNKDIQEMKDALARGDLEAALKAAMNATNSLGKMLAEMEQHAQQYADSTYSRTLQEMNALEKGLRELEEGERKVAQQTEDLKKDMQSRTFGDMDQALNGFFEKQLDRLGKMKDDISHVEKSFAENSTLAEYSRVEKEVERLLKRRNQAMRSPFSLKDREAEGFGEKEYVELNKKLRELNEARNREPLLDTYEEVSKALPQLEEKLSQLDEMLKGQDFKESLNLAMDSLRNLRFWDFELERSSSESVRRPGEKEEFPDEGLQEMSKDTGEMLADAARLNEQMVNDLESVEESFEKMSKAEPTEEETKQFAQLTQKQGELKEDAQSLARSMEELAGKSRSMGGEAAENMEEAEEFMEAAEGKLQGKNGPGALTDERESLYRLSQARKNLGEAMDRVAKGMMSRGLPMPKYVLKYRDRWDDGRDGFAMGEVEIPSEESYKVPKEFREDILEAMKKGLPQRYHELNKDYYRKLVE